jgi:hypothetical protein
MPSHVNAANCDKCEEIFNKYPGFHVGLRAWLLALRKKDATAHISCAGRGKIDQEACVVAGTSKAHFGRSAHNFNLAIDIFRLTHISGDSQALAVNYDRSWFRDVVGTAVFKHNSEPDSHYLGINMPHFQLSWYGAPNAKFFELPHIEIMNWTELDWKPVEPL